VSRLNPVIAGLPTTIFTVMSALATQHKAVNLGQGFPDEDGPADIRQVAADALLTQSNQYPPMRGVPALRAAVAAHDQRFYGLPIDPDAGVLVTSGATEALAAAILAFVAPGTRVLVFEPVYDSYAPMIELAGGIVQRVRLRAPDWSVPWDAVDAAFAAGTGVVLLNTPMNPCGKVWSADELDQLARRLVAHDALAICDDVYEHLVFDGARHVTLLERPGMLARAVKIGSAGKTFSLTGWKVGYLSGAPALVEACAKAHQFLTFTTPPALQAGIAFGLCKPDAYFQGLAAGLQAKRDRLAAGLADIGFTVLPCQGTYFLTADYSAFSDAADVDFARHLVTQIGVACIPLSPFYARPDPSQRLIRFCFIKQDAVLDEGLARLRLLQSAGPRVRASG
jgi:aspartate/methionine/tyrosine aminotransferase